MKLLNETINTPKQRFSSSISEGSVNDHKESPSFDDIIKYHRRGRDLHSKAVFLGFRMIKKRLFNLVIGFVKKYKN